MKRKQIVLNLLALLTNYFQLLKNLRLIYLTREKTPKLTQLGYSKLIINCKKNEVCIY